MAENARKRIGIHQLELKGSEAYKPFVLPNAIKVIKGNLTTAEEAVEEMTSITTLCRHSQEFI
ncbi:hypothetical protein ACFQI7_07345 [Paenibacillus allorhizosphaerae]|uniref:hypothetical protein n=1 Tax=Paenibacillus allorhizosphaerae TaxID=2849866 RepID=UPI001C4076E8|nr:hypothetical protein [Paenibacillus allorhizosphaerae]